MMLTATAMPVRSMTPFLFFMLALASPALAREQIFTLAPSDPEQVVGFGATVAIGGEYIAAGARSHATWSVFVFRHNDNATPSYPFDDTWIEEAILVPSDSQPNDGFGASVAIDGDRLVVGAIFFDPGVWTAGAAYVFRRDPDGWVEEAKLAPPELLEGDAFGGLVAISGDRIVVGTLRAPNQLPGAYVFRRAEGTWIQEAVLMPSGVTDQRGFPPPVAIHGDLIAIGMSNEDVPAENAGAAYVFGRVGTVGWVEAARLTPSDPAEGHAFGSSVSISEDRVIVGAPGDDTVGPNSGSAYVFGGDGADWLERTKLTLADAEGLEQFGESVVVSGSMAVVGSKRAHAYLYRRVNGSWVQKDVLVPRDAAPPYSAIVAADGDFAVVVRDVYFVGTDPGPIPTLSIWGTAAMAALVVAAGVIMVRRCRAGRAVLR